jgi:hypothetical protein
MRSPIGSPLASQSPAGSLGPRPTGVSISSYSPLSVERQIGSAVQSSLRFASELLLPVLPESTDFCLGMSARILSPEREAFPEVEEETIMDFAPGNWVPSLSIPHREVVSEFASQSAADIQENLKEIVRPYSLCVSTAACSPNLVVLPIRRRERVNGSVWFAKGRTSSSMAAW